MNKKLIVGMMIMTSVISFNAFAGPTAARSPKEMVMDYMKEMDTYKANVRDGKIKLSSLETAEALETQSKTMDNLGLSTKEKNSIKSYIASGKAQKVDVIATLNVLAAAKNGTVGKTDAESVSIRNYVDAATKLLTNIDLISEKTQSSQLSAKEFTDATNGLKKMVEILEQPTAWEGAERDVFTATLNKLGDTAPRAETIQQAFVDSVSATAKNTDNTVGVPKDKAMDMIRKLIACMKKRMAA